MTAGKPPPSSLRQTAARGVKWTSAAALVTIASQLVLVAVLARLLTPAEFGVAALAVAILGFGAILTDAGLSAAIIARQTTSREVLSSLYWTNALTGVLSSTLVAAAAPLIAAAFGQAELKNLLLLGAVMFLIVPFGQQFRIVLQRELRFQALGVIDAISALAAATAAIVAAAAGLGAASLVINLLVLNGARSLLCGIRGWRIAPVRIHFRWSEVRSYVGFGLYTLGQRLFGHAAYNVDYLIIGKVLGPVALGPYTVAYQLVVRPQVQLTPILNQVAFPIFARRRDDDAALGHGVSELSHLIALVSFPALVGLAAVAPDFVPVVLGPQWAAAVPLVQILAFLGAIRALTQPAGSVLLGRDRPDAAFWITAASLAGVSAAVLVGVQFGVVEAAWAHVAAVAAVFAFQVAVLHRVIRLAPAAYLRALATPALLAFAVGAAVLLGGHLLDLMDATRTVSLMAQIASGVAVYGLFLWAFHANYLRELRGLLRDR